MRIAVARPTNVAKALVCIFFLFTCQPAFSLGLDRGISQISYKFWSESDGAPSPITALAQTEDGYLWIGSERGLFRFDGVKFQQYQPPRGVELPSYNIYALMATPDGGLWIAFNPTGLALLKNGSLTVFARKDELPDSAVHCFARDREGRIWAGTETGLFLRQGTRWISIGSRWNLPREMIRSLLVDHGGTLWVATVKRIAFLRPDSKRFELGGAVGTGTTKLAQANDGRVWFADDGTGEVRPVPLNGRNSESEFPAIVGKGLSELLFDRNGALWITQWDGSGIIRVRDPEKLNGRKYGAHDRQVELFGKKDGFPGGGTYKLMEDREGNIWVGCSNGLLQFRHNDVVPMRLPQGYQGVTLAAGKYGTLWVGANNDEPVLHILGQKVLRENAGEQVASVFHASNGDIWWGCRSGIWRQRGTEFKYFPLPKGTVPDFMWDIIPSTADDGLWVRLGDVGFAHFNQGAWNLHDWPKGVPSIGDSFRRGPSASYVDDSGRIWLGYTSGQVIVLDGNRATLYSRSDGLDVGRIKVIRGRGQQIWEGGERGLMFFSKGRFWRVTAVGEALGTISGIIETGDGGLWLNEIKGIVHIPPEEVRQFIADPNYHVQYRRFDNLDGLPGAPQMEYTDSTAVETQDGRLWFATDNGLAWIDPAHLVKNTVPPPVSITSISNERHSESASGSVKFAARTHTVEIDYTALSFSVPQRVKFRFKLEGVDPEWQNVGTRREAYYNNLGPGRYRFRVTACNNDGVWNNTGASLDFSIAPAYYQTSWFRAACLCVFIVLIWMLYRLRLRSIEQRYLERNRAEEVLRRAQAELARINRVSTMGELTASLAHEIKQPIGAAVTNADACLQFLDRDQPDMLEAREAALEMAKDARRAADIIEHVRSLYRKDSSHQDTVDVNEVIREMVMLLENEANRHSVTMHTDLTSGLPTLIGDRVQLQQALMNLMLNGIEAMQDTTGGLSIKSQFGKDGQVLISVSDTGVGLPTGNDEQIFNAFFTTKSQGTGLGLAITRSIVESHGGRIWATANPEGGATFQFTLAQRSEAHA